MDGFMDQVAQNLGTDDIIRANAEAEAREFENVKNQVAEYENKVSDYESRVSDYESKVADFEVRVNDYENRVSDYENKVSDYENKVSDYENKVSDYENKVSDYENKVTGYEDLLSEIRRLNLKSVETNEMTNQLVSTSVERLEEYKAATASKDYSEDIGTIKDTLRDQEEYIHKENVRVYRNVQASIVDELKLQTEALGVQNKALEKKISGLKGVTVTALIFSGIGMLGVIAMILMNVLNITF